MTAVHGTGEGAIEATGEPDRLPDGSVGPAGPLRHDATGAG